MRQPDGSLFQSEGMGKLDHFAPPLTLSVSYGRKPKPGSDEPSNENAILRDEWRSYPLDLAEESRVEWMRIAGGNTQLLNVRMKWIHHVIPTFGDQDARNLEQQRSCRR